MENKCGCVSPSPASSISGVLRLWQSQLLPEHTCLLRVHICMAFYLQQDSLMVTVSKIIPESGPGASAGRDIIQL